MASGAQARHALGDWSSVQPAVTVVLVSYNTREFTLRCLDSLRGATATIATQVIVVDNDSRDDSGAAVVDQFPATEVIANDTNVGFARAVNQALRRATGEYVLLLNPDCVVGSDTISGLIDYLRSHPDVGVAAPRVVQPASRHRVLSAGYLPSAPRLFAHFFGLNRLPVVGPRLPALNLRPGPDTDRPREVEWVSGACLIAPRSLFEDLGGLSERWFMYAEDMDFCARVRDRGLKVVHLPAPEIAHEVGASAEGISTTWIDNLEDFYVLRYHPSRFRLYWWRAVFAAGLATRAAGFLVRAVLRPDESDTWRSKARAFAAYTRRALRRREAAP